MEQEILNKWMNRLTVDKRINIWHKSILMALVEVHSKCGCQNPFQISRRQIMGIAKIKGCPTYHKYMKELQQLKYLEYSPSYHPAMGSKVHLLTET